MLKSKGKTCMVEEPSDVKQLSLNQMCKIGLMIRGKVFHSPRIPGIRPNPVETVNILQDSVTFRLVYKKPDIPFHFLLFFLPLWVMQSRLYLKKTYLRSVSVHICHHKINYE
jgi:hypothetical protein